MHEDNGKGILKKALIFRLQHPSIQGSLSSKKKKTTTRKQVEQTNYTFKEKEIFAICRLIERVSHICVSLYIYVINNFDKKFISCF